MSDLWGMNTAVAWSEPHSPLPEFTYLLVGHAVRVQGTIYDVSPSGICVETWLEVPLGVTVTVDAGAYTTEAVVRRCTAHGSRYRIDLDLNPFEGLACGIDGRFPFPVVPASKMC